MCTHECTVHIHVHACRGQRRTSDVHLSLSWLLRHSLCTWSLFGLDWMARKLPGFSCLWFPSFSSTGVTVLHMIMPGFFFVGAEDLNLGPLTFIMTAPPNRASSSKPQGLHFIFITSTFRNFPSTQPETYQVVWSSSSYLRPKASSEDGTWDWPLTFTYTCTYLHMNTYTRAPMWTYTHTHTIQNFKICQSIP